MNKSQQDQRARKHGEHNIERRMKRAGRIQHLQETPDYALHGAVGPKPMFKVPEQKPLKKTALGFFKRMFRRVTGGA